MTKVIDLNQYIGVDIRVLSGYDNGKAIRKKIELDEIEIRYPTIEVIIPICIYSFNSSYFRGMFGESIMKYGHDFEKKYTFICDEYVRRYINFDIEHILLCNNGIPAKPIPPKNEVIDESFSLIPDNIKDKIRRIIKIIKE